MVFAGATLNKKCEKICLFIEQNSQLAAHTVK